MHVTCVASRKGLHESRKALPRSVIENLVFFSAVAVSYPQTTTRAAGRRSGRKSRSHTLSLCLALKPPIAWLPKPWTAMMLA